MAPKILAQLFSVLILVSSSSAASSCNPADQKALLAIKAAFNNAYHFASWTTDSPCCDWYDVDCTNGRVTGLSIFDDDDIAGTIPAAIADLTQLQNLLLKDLPKLTGSIPPQLANLKNIQLFRIINTSISGPVPTWLSKLTTVSIIDLSYNSLTGNIPASLGTSALKNLAALHLEHNNLNGPIPASFGSFSKSSPPDLYLSYNSLSGLVPSSLGALNWGIIDLSNNQLLGDVSFLFGASKATTQLDISYNGFNFDLSKVSFPLGLTSLILNHNSIIGNVPAQINQVTGLVAFDVSDNQLCGEIPAGSVTAKFSASAYKNNKCLCGYPLPAC